MQGLTMKRQTKQTKAGILCVDRGQGKLIARLRSSLKHSYQKLKQEKALRKRTVDVLNMRIRQQASAADISRMILAAGRLDELMQEILRNVSETLSADSCNVLELQPDDVTLVLRACHGWSAGEVGKLSVRADVDSPIGLTVRLRQPITFEDLNVDERFLHMHLVLRDHGMVSGVCVIIPGEATGVWGALSVQSRQRQQFSADDVNYLQIVARILADAITASAGRENLIRSEQLLRRYYDAGQVGMALSAPGKGWLQINDTFCEMIGYTRGELLGLSWESILHPDELPAARAHFQRMAAGEVDGYTRDSRYLHKGGHVVPVTVSTKCARKADGTIDYVVVFVQDISERRHMEKTLRKNEERLREAQRLARLGFWEWDVRSGETYWSDEMYTIIGVQPESFDLRHASIMDLIHPDDRAAYKELFRTVLRVGKVHDIEHRIVRPGGEIRYHNVQAELIKDANGEPIRIRGTVMDITERVRAEEAIKHSEHRLRQAQRLAKLGFWELDLVTNKVYWSDELYEITGLDPRSFELDYDSISSFVPAEDRASYEEFFRKVLDEGSVHGFEHRVLTPNGEIRYHNVHGELIRDADGTPDRMLGTVMDVTERRQAQESLRQARDELEKRVEERTMELYLSTERARSLSAIAETTLQNMGQGIIMVNADNKILIYNDLLQNYTGVSREQAMRCRSLDEYLMLYKEAAGEEEFLRDAQYSRMGERIAYEMTTPDGKIIEVRQNPLLGGGFVRTYTDITQLKQVQADYLAAKERAEAANLAKANFLATMSHEIRTPMNGVIGMTDLLLQTRLDDEQREMLQTINDCGQSLLTIINDILDFSKIEAGKLELEAIPMSLTDVVEGSAQTIVHNAIRKELRLLTFVDPSLPQFVTGDPVRLRQILINLGGNAIKFTEKGKVVIRADRVAGSEHGNVVVRFAVIDEGIGISRAAQRNLFKPFTQAESSTTRRYGGTGLGLSICQRLAEMMNGEIGVHSSVGEGSEFYLTLALRRSDKVRRHVNVSDLGGLKILLIAGDDVELEIYRRYLAHWHADVEACNDLGGCLEHCRSAAAQGGSYDVVIVSSQWPVEQQLEMSRVVREDPPLAATRFVLLKRGRRRRPRLENDGGVTLDVDQLRRSAFLSAVSIAAGRASPEVDYEAQIEEMQKIKTAAAPSVERALAQDRLILVAEDNPTNRDVIRRQLNVLGYACEMVEDGRQALAALRGKRYALLLTDCQMPNMDGFELTSRIRREEEATGRHIGIIAITANALQGEAERCLAAGMDDYLAKPIDMKELRDKLRQWLPPVDTETKGDARPARLDSSRARPHPGGNGGACPINETALQSLFGDDPQAFKEILHDFIDPSQKIIHEIENGWKARCADDIRRAAHKLKSAARSIGADRLADLCVSLETAGREENWEMLDEEVPSLNQLMKDIEKYIARL
jgi:PAS domain S-box-containing protein